MRLIRYLLLPSLLIAAAGPAAAAIEAPRELEDSTFVQTWKLDNGLRVATRHVPRAAAVAITVAYDFGNDDDPKGREGLAMLLGEIGFTAAAGDIPERTREDLDSQRPHGWSLTATRRSVMFTEIAATSQFPGVLQQVATRMRGVTVTREGLRAAMANVRSEMQARVNGQEPSLYHLTREAALGHENSTVTPGRDLERMTAESARQQMQRLMVPANAALTLAGNLEDVDVPKLIQDLFGPLPAGTRLEHGRRDSLRAGAKSITLAQAQGRRGVVGIIAPPLTDPAHPGFYLSTMMLGTHFNRVWTEIGNPSLPPPSYRSFLHYAIFDEPDLVRLFPPGAATPDDLGTVLKDAINQLYTTVIPSETFEEMRRNLLWLLGGPMTDEQRTRARRDTSVLHTLARSMAGRELFGGEAVWGPYRERFTALPDGGLQSWMSYYQAPEHQVRLMTVPNR